MSKDKTNKKVKENKKTKETKKTATKKTDKKAKKEKGSGKMQAIAVPADIHAKVKKLSEDTGKKAYQIVAEAIEKYKG